MEMSSSPRTSAIELNEQIRNIIINSKVDKIINQDNIDLSSDMQAAINISLTNKPPIPHKEEMYSNYSDLI
jgi:hypothetical protein